MKAKRVNYKNWVPKGMIVSFGAVTAGFAAGAVGLLALGKGKKLAKLGAAACGAGALGCGAMTGWCVMAYRAFSYDGKRKLSRQIVEGTADYVTLPEGGLGLDVGCGSGALTIACAKRNPRARMLGCDRWGMEYASFSQKLCEDNAAIEGLSNVRFQNGDATKLPFGDESFDCVTSNYVYHNIVGRNKQELLLETLRTLKKGGTFAIHDLMGPLRYGSMKKFQKKLYEMGYERVELIDTTRGKFMSRGEALRLMLGGSTLLVGKK